MRPFLQRFPSLLARPFIHSPANFRHSNTSRCVVPLVHRAISRFVLFSSESHTTPTSESDEVVSKEELKKRIQSFLDDEDEGSLPDLFEAMMNRKLSGKHDQSDDEVMEEVRKYQVNDALKVNDTDSDIENDDLRDGNSSDSDIESDNLRVGDSSDSDFDFDGLKNVDLSGPGIKVNGLKADHLSGSDSESD